MMCVRVNLKIVLIERVKELSCSQVCHRGVKIGSDIKGF